MTDLLGPPTALFTANPDMPAALEGRVTQLTTTSTGVRLLISHYQFYQTEELDAALGTLPSKEAARYEKESGSWQTALLLSVSFFAQQGAPRREDLAPGARIFVRGEVNLPEAPTCPGQFDARSYWRARKVLLQIRDPAQVRVIPSRNLKDRILAALGRFAGRLCGGMDLVFTPEEAGLMRAMTLGDRADLTPQMRRLFSGIGISHILAISGFHLSLIGFGIFRLLRRIRLPYAACAAVSCGFAAAYCHMTGSGISARRALILFLFSMGGAALGRKSDRLTAIGAAACLLALDCPYVLFDSAFLLSFACVLTLAALPEGAHALLVSFAVWAGALPLSLCFFYQLSPYSPLLSPLMLAPVGALMILSLLAGAGALFSVPVGTAIALPCRVILRFWTALPDLVRRLPGAVIVTGRPALWKVLLCYAAILLFVLVTKKKTNTVNRGEEVTTVPAFSTFLSLGRVLPLITLLAAFLLLFVRVRPSLRITFLDVGQGDSILIEAGADRYLIDAGSSQVTHVWTDRIEPALKSLGIGRLNAVFLTHGDHDHISGIEEYLGAACRRLDGRDASGVTVPLLVTSACAGEDDGLRQLAALAAAKDIPVRSIDRGAVVRAGDGTLTCLYPGAGESTHDANQDSLVLLGRFWGFSILFTGDLEKEGEMRLIRQSGGTSGGAGVNVDILKAGHHGSANATSQALLELFSPKAAVISCGRKNVYGHPAAEVLQRLAAAGCKTLRTDTQGSVILQRKGGRIRIKTLPP